MQENIESNPLNQSISEPVPTVTTVSTNNQQPKTNSFLVILLSVLLLISVLIAGFFAFQTQKLVKELTLLRSEPNSEATVEPITEPVATSSSMTIDPTAGWKIYTNQKYNFSLSYPGLWNKDDAGSLIAVSDTQGNYSLQIDAVEVYESGYCYTWDKEAVISIAGKSARMRNGTYTGKPAEICGTQNSKNTNRSITQIFIPYQGSVELLISYYYSVTDLDSAKVMLNQILSTLKFTD